MLTSLSASGISLAHITKRAKGDFVSEARSVLGNTTELGSPSQFAEEYSYTALRFYMLAIARAILPNHRVQVCWRYPLPNYKNVEVIYSEEKERARTKGTMKCGSGWVCPACTLYIGERRRAELGQALKNARGKYAVVMVTYTCAHNRNMKLKELLQSMQKAFRHLKSGKTWQEIKSEFYLVGSIRAIEITHGAAGWHPHFHELMVIDIEGIKEFYEGELAEYSEGLEALMQSRWMKGLTKQGLTGNKELALRISFADGDAAQYIAKHGRMPLETDFKGQTDEITRGTSKMARSGNSSVWDLLFQAPVNEKSKYLFLEYANATKGRSQLQWSRGLKSLLGIDEIRDLQASEGIETETDRILAEINHELWRFIVERRYIEQLMTIAHTGDEEKVKRLVGLISAKWEKQLKSIYLPDIGH